MMVERAIRAAEMGFDEFIHATNGKDALQVLMSERRAGNKFDLIVADHNMPEMSGLDFLEQVKAMNLSPTSQIVMVTTENSEEHLARAAAAGSKGNIAKPFTPEQIKEVVGPLFA
jgi:two-component system chemotaxis response regulator CheY